MSHRLAVGGCVLASALALAAPALAKPSPSLRSHDRAAANSNFAHANAARPATAAPTTPATATLYVSTTGTDTGTCRLSSHPCKTIGYALGQAPAGSTINVAAGTYPEQLTITKNVTIKGALSDGAPVTFVKPNSVAQNDTDPDNSGQPPYPIVDFAPGVTKGNLTGIIVDGTGATSSITGCGQDYIGVYYHDASGTLNTDNVTGIQSPPGLTGCQGGLGVLVNTDSGSATPSNVTMTNVKVDKYDKNGITCDDLGTVCTISKSTVTGIGATGLVGQNGIQFFDSAGSVANSVVTDNSYTSPFYCPTGTCNSGGPGTSYTTATGILVLDAGTMTLTGNIVNRNDENVYEGYDPSAFGDTTPAPRALQTTKANNLNNAVNNTGTGGSTKVPFGYGVGDGLDLDGSYQAIVSGNTAWSEPEFGIGLFATTGTTVLGNRTGKTGSTDGDGIYVGDPANAAINQNTNSSGNTIQSNTSNANVFDGILADSFSSGNTFKSNTLQNNLNYDAEDKSSGGGTAGTANTWAGNHCLPSGDSSPPGLCS